MKSGSGKLPGLLALISTLLLILRVCFFQQVSAQTTSDIFWFEDASGKLTLDDILQQDTTTEWSKLEQTHLNFGFTRSVFWLNVPFENGQDIHQAMLLEVAFPLHDNIDVYLLDNNKLIKTYHTGDQHPFTSRPLNHRNFLFPYTTPPQKKLRAIVRLQSTDTMYLPVKVWTESNFFASDQHQMLLFDVSNRLS